MSERSAEVEPGARAAGQTGEAEQRDDNHGAATVLGSRKTCSHHSWMKRR